MPRHKSRHGEFPESRSKHFEGCWFHVGHETCARMENALRDVRRTSPVRTFGAVSTIGCDVEHDLRVNVGEDGSVTWDAEGRVDKTLALALNRALTDARGRVVILERAIAAMERLLHRRYAKEYAK